MATDEAPVYEFGDFRLEVGERRLLRGGQSVPLTTKVFETLRVLLERSGRLLTKDELMRLVWPDTVVEENNLNHNISVLRRALGEQSAGQRFIETVPRVGYRFVADVTQPGSATSTHRPAASTASARTLRQEIRFCTSGDGTRIAYSAVGTGPPLAKAANWLSHIEYEWDSPVWKHWIGELSQRHLLVRWDERGCGLSDWNVEDISLDAWVRDQEAVVDALSLDRFALLGISQGGAVAAAYAARHPERVSHLVLCGAYARGWRHRGNAREIEARTALVNLTRLGWGQNNPAFRQLFTTRFIPDAGAAEMEWFNDLQRVSSSPENAARLMEGFSRLDVRALLADIKAPTIVFHSRHDNVVSFDEGRLLAAGIQGSTFVPLPSRNHLLLEREPAWPIFLRELGTFLGWPETAPTPSYPGA
ncbi:MAG TPA: alpha/beta fold hydrolase [Vicinamibacterales bacterium]|nr:alpha/beta fold hydrolase [Vicinamibacterales bacterium]